MIDKRIPTPAEAVADVKDGDMVLISGFGEAGNPTELIHALIDQGTKDLSVVNNNAGNGHMGLIKAESADPWGHLTYRMAARNFAPVMCMAAETTIVQVRQIVDLGAIDAEHVVTPSIFVDRIVEIPEPISEAAILRQAERVEKAAAP